MDTVASLQDSVERYRIEKLVEAGSQANAFQAFDLELNRPVILKIFHTGTENAPNFKHEALLLTGLRHPHVRQVYELIKIQHRWTLVCEYLDQGNLKQWLQTKQPLIKRLEIAYQICSGLAAAHDKGIIHRDLKLEHIFLDASGQAKIADFGIALNTKVQSILKTQNTEPHYGTPFFASPEHYTSRPLTEHSDIYSMGVVLFCLMTNKTRLEKSHELEAEHLPKDCRNLPNIKHLIEDMLQPHPDNRPLSIQAVAQSLQHTIEHITQGSHTARHDPLAANQSDGQTTAKEIRDREKPDAAGITRSHSKMLRNWFSDNGINTLAVVAVLIFSGWLVFTWMTT